MAVEYALFNGKRYHRNVETGEKYFIRGNITMHRAVWKYYNGEIPKGYHIHHIDGNPANNDISNLTILSCTEHLKLHMKQHMQDPEYVERMYRYLDKARIEANKWHGSPAGIEWHKIHGMEVAKQVKPIKFTCEYCGKEFMAKPNGLNRFCSNKCKSGYRLHLGVDNETRICVICGKEFTINKYYKMRTCSRECGFKLLSQEKKGKIPKQLPQKESVCPKCGKPMMVSGYSKGRMCDECKKESVTTTSVCEICGKVFEHNKYNNARFCSVECVGKYNTIMKKKRGLNVNLESLVRIRREKGLTQKMVGEFLGVTQSAYGDYEKGYSCIRQETLDKLCALFGCTKESLGVY